MNPFEKLTESEKNAIRSYITSYGGHDGDYLDNGPSASLDYILRFWNKNKESFFKMFKNNLILSQDIQYSRPLDCIEEDMEEITSEYHCDCGQFIEEWLQMIKDVCGPYSWDSYNEKIETLRSHLYDLINPYYLARNVYSNDTFFIHSDILKKDIKIERGCKIIKAISKIVKAKGLSQENFEKFRIAHSMCLNQKAMHGKLCLSIHPLDYMTMSDNESNWQSCMNWQDGGEYRQGTVEMMNSPFIVMAYLDAKNNDFMVNGSRWSNKKWRQLFVVTPKIIMGIKPYPYYSEECEKNALCWLRTLAEEAGFGTYMDEMQKIDNDSTVFLTDDREVRFRFSMHHMYNDISRGHKAFVTKTDSLEEYEEFMLSGETECMSCGEDYTYNRDRIDVSNVCCDECLHMFRCAGCGDIIYDENYYELDGEYYCSYCYDNKAVECPLCGEIHNCDNFASYYITFDDETIPDSSYQVDVCEDCSCGGEVEKAFGPSCYATLNSGWYNSSRRAVNPKNFAEGAWGHFFDSEEEYQNFLESHEVH